MGFGKKLQKAVKSYVSNPFNAKRGLKGLASVTRHFRQRLGLRRKQIFPFTSNGFYADSSVDNPYGATGSIASKFR